MAENAPPITTKAHTEKSRTAKYFVENKSMQKVGRAFIQTIVPHTEHFVTTYEILLQVICKRQLLKIRSEVNSTEHNYLKRKFLSSHTKYGSLNFYSFGSSKNEQKTSIGEITNLPRFNMFNLSKHNKVD